jgi:tetratricopeptide (TPR) repeat protein
MVLELEPESGNQSDVQLAALYQKALGAAKTPEVKFEALTSLVNLYLSAAAQNFELAEQYARAAMSIDPHRSNPYTGLAILYASRGNWADLDAVLAEAEKAVPDNLAPYCQAGRILFLQGADYARAEQCFRKFLTQEPEAGAVTLAHAHWRLGRTLEKQGKRADAIAEMEQATRLKPDLDEAKKDLRRLRGS